MTRKQLFLGILFLLAFDFGMDGYLDMKQALQTHNESIIKKSQKHPAYHFVSK